MFDSPVEDLVMAQDEMEEMTERQSEATRESAERWSQLREELCAMHTEQKETAVHQSEMFTVLRQQSGEELRTVRDEAQQAQDKVKHLDMALEEALKRAEEESKIADDKLKERVTHENADTVAIQAQITSNGGVAIKITPRVLRSTSRKTE